MENETEKIITAQMNKLPNEVMAFLSSSKWSEDLDEIGNLYSLPEKDLLGFKREASFVLVGLVHPDGFKEALEKEVGIKPGVAEVLTENVEKKIFEPIRPALISFFEKETAENKEVVPSEIVPSQKTPSPSEDSSTEMPELIREWEKAPDVAPDNLPTETKDETEPLFPPIPQKIMPIESATSSVHPFEEKMKLVFAEGKQPVNEQEEDEPTHSFGTSVFSDEMNAELLSPSPEGETSKVSIKESPKTIVSTSSDPYREPIE